MEHLVTFIYGGEIQRLEENEGFKIIDNLIKIFGFPKDLRQKCPIEQSDNWNFDTISISDENEANTSDDHESPENSFVFEKSLIEKPAVEEEPLENIGSLEPSPTQKPKVEYSKSKFDQKFLEFPTKNQEEEENTSLPNNQNIEKELMDINCSDANDYLFENIFSIAQSDEELEAGQSKTDLQGGP